MVISGTLALIATTVSLFGAVNTSANVVGAYQDKQLIQDSLNNMQQTQQLLQQKATQATGAQQQQMLTAAAKLSQVNSKMTELNNQVFSNSVRREGLGFAKGLLTGKASELSKIGKAAEGLISIGDAAADQVIGNNGLQGTLNNLEMQDWNAAAQAGDELDLQILILQARELTKRTKALDKEMQQLQSWYQQEAPGNTDSTEIDQQVAQIVDNNPELIQQLQGQAPAKDNQDQEQNTVANDQNNNQPADSDPKSGVGLDFLKDLAVHGKEINVTWTRADDDDSHFDSWRKHGYGYTTFSRQWDAFANREVSNVEMTMVINEDDTVSGKMKGTAFIQGHDTEIDFNLEGVFDPQSKQFNGKIVGKMKNHDTADTFVTPEKYVSDWQQSRVKRWDEEVASQFFTFHGSVDEDNRKINGYFSFFHWRKMEGEY